MAVVPDTMIYSYQQPAMSTAEVTLLIMLLVWMLHHRLAIDRIIDYRDTKSQG